MVLWNSWYEESVIPGIEDNVECGVIHGCIRGGGVG